MGRPQPPVVRLPTTEDRSFDPSQECVLAVPMDPGAGMEATDRNLLYGDTDLSVLTVAEGYVTTPIQLIAGDL
jgi:hypothetical protein